MVRGGLGNIKQSAHSMTISKLMGALGGVWLAERVEFILKLPKNLSALAPSRSLKAMSVKTQVFARGRKRLAKVFARPDMR